MITFVVYGSPVAQPRQRHRVVAAHGKVFSTNYTPKKDPVNQWKADIKTAAVAVRNGEKLWSGPVELHARFYLPRPQSRFRKKDPDGFIWCTSKPDTDNLIKAVKDALSGVIFVDDKQVCYEETTKFYHEKDKGPRAEIEIAEIEIQEIEIDEMVCR